MKVRIELITPEAAKAYLQNNMINRNINEKRVAAYADDMKKGEWQLNGEAIRFNENGELIDGQHRLSAIVKANIPVQMVVMYEIDNSVSIYDRGRIRSVTDSLLIDGMDRRIATTTCVAIAKLHYAVQKSAGAFSDSQVKSFLVKNQDTLLELLSSMPGVAGGKSGTKGLRVSTRSAPLLLALFYAYRCGEDLERLSKFVSVFQSGFYNDPSEISAIVCRNDAIAGNLSTHSGSERMKALYKYEKAINDFCAGYPRKVSYNSWDKPIYSNNIIFKED